MLIIIVAVSTRLWGIGDVGFNSDESVYSGQAANLAGYQEFSEHFSIFRAHPLLFQFFASLVFERFGVVDIFARLVSVVFSTSTVYVTYILGSKIYNTNVGLASSFILSVIPYHISVSRLAIVDAPYAFFYSLTLFFIVKYVTEIPNKQNTLNNVKYTYRGKKIFDNTRNIKYLKDQSLKFLRNNATNNLWLYAIGICGGLTFLSKEVGALALISTLVYLRFKHKLGIVKILLLVVIFLITISPHLILLTIRDEASQNAGLYTSWQLTRPPNHPPSFYPIILQNSLGIILSGLCILATVYGIKSKKERASTVLLLTWIAIPLLFFQLWPTKGFYYILPLIPAFVILGTSFLFTPFMMNLRHNKKIILFLIILIPFTTSSGISLLFPSNGNTIYLAGSGGLPFAREAAQWIKENTPEGSVFMTIGPSMGNVIKFYANRDTLAISINPNPALHNPSYEPIINPDQMIKSGQINYIVYDMFSAARTQHFAEKVLHHANKFNGTLVYEDYKTYKNQYGETVTEPAILIYVLNNIKGGVIR